MSFVIASTAENVNTVDAMEMQNETAVVVDVDKRITALLDVALRATLDRHRAEMHEAQREWNDKRNDIEKTAVRLDELLHEMASLIDGVDELSSTAHEQLEHDRQELDCAMKRGIELLEQQHREELEKIEALRFVAK